MAEHLFEVGISGLTTTFPPLRTAMEAGNLPDRLTTFVGRRRELDELESLLEGVRLLTIVGPGGVGKTSVAIEVARRGAARHADGSWLVRLESVADVERMAAAIVEALGLVDAGSRTYWEQLRDHAAGRQMLLVLDNLEQVSGAGPAARILPRVGSGGPCHGHEPVAASRRPASRSSSSSRSGPRVATRPTSRTRQRSSSIAPGGCGPAT